MKFLKEKKGIIISFIIGVIIASSITVYAYSYFASDIGYAREGTNITNVGEALNDLYEKNKNSATIENFTANFYLSGDSRTNYCNFSYFDIDVKNYKKISLNISNIYYSDPSVFTCYISTDNDTRTSITTTGNYEIDVTNNEIARIYYYENSGYMYVTGTYTLSN